MVSSSFLKKDNVVNAIYIAVYNCNQINLVDCFI